MTSQKLFKRRVRERMSKTGERYAAARSQILRHRSQAAPASEPGLAPQRATTATSPEASDLASAR